MKYTLVNITACELMNIIINDVLYFLLALVLSFVLLYYSGKCSNKDAAIKQDVKYIKRVTKDYFPIYLGYFLVALSLPDNGGSPEWSICLIVYLIIVLLILFSGEYYFNPLYLVFGFHYYEIRTNNSIELIVLTNQEINKDSGPIRFEQAKEITNFVLVEYD